MNSTYQQLAGHHYPETSLQSHPTANSKLSILSDVLE